MSALPAARGSLERHPVRMDARRVRWLFTGLVTAAALLTAGGALATVTTYGTLDNFGAINDTGGITRGFEIELEWVARSAVVYTFADRTSAVSASPGSA